MKNETKILQSNPEEGEIPEPSLSPVPSIVLYDKITGRIVETHHAESVATGDSARLDPDRFLKEAAEDPFTMDRVSGRKAENLGALEAPPGAELNSGLMVDIGSGKLVPKPMLQLSAAKTELEGDGKDSTEIEVSLVDAKGKRIPGFDSEIEVRTTRGKLSARGGRIKLSGGHARITLTSVAETVSRVEVSARSLGAPAVSANISLAFL